MHTSIRSPATSSAAFPPLFNEEQSHVLVDLSIRTSATNRVIATRCKIVSVVLRGMDSCGEPVCEHPETEVSDLGFCEHIQQVSCVCIVDIVISTAMGEEIVYVLEALYM